MIIPKIRCDDIWGSGAYHAKRGNRLHKGADYICDPEQVIYSDVYGTVNRIGTPYNLYSTKGFYRLIEIQVDAQTRLKYMYILPTVSPGDIICTGDQLGICQDLTKIYPNITNHYHLEVFIEGHNVNPDIWIKNYDRRPCPG